jgi:Fur family transcriptional regulator, peroxide stress response regulator
MKQERIKHSIVNGLKDLGLKLTPQRRVVVDILTRDKSHPSALSIFQAARETHPSISLSTVYATLALLKKHRLIRELEFEGMDNRYDMDTDNHFNLICLRCGRIEDYINPAPVLPEVVEQQTGFRVHDVRLEFYGVCSTCAP